MPCAHGGYKASFEACFMELGHLQKHNFQQCTIFHGAVGKQQKKSWPCIILRQFHNASSLGSFPD